MKPVIFVSKSQEEIDDWIESAEKNLSENDFSYIATLAWNLSNLEEFVFSTDEISNKFFDYMKETKTYHSVLH